MGLEAVTEEVLKQTEQESENILKSANEEAQSIIAAAKKKIKAEEGKVLEESKEKLILFETKELASANLQVKKNLLIEKKKLIDQIMAEVFEQAEKFDDAERKKHINALIKKASESLEIGKVLVNKHDKKFIEGIDSEESDTIGGIIAVNKDETERVDYSYESILDSLQQKHIAEVAALLFKK